MRSLSLCLLAAVASAKKCTERKNCHECSVPGNASSSDLCFWCYDSGKCLDVQNPFTHGGKALHGCQNFSFTQEDCECSQFQTCAECARPSHAIHPACEWTNTSTNLTLVTTAAGSTETKTLQVGSRVGCREGRTPFGGALGPRSFVHNMSWTIGGDGLSLAIVETPLEWFWAQCSISGPAPAAIATGALLLLLGGLCCLVACVCRRAKRRRRRDPFTTTFTQPMINSQPPQASSDWPPQR